jgi:hypothetical protein
MGTLTGPGKQKPVSVAQATALLHSLNALALRSGRLGLKSEYSKTAHEMISGGEPMALVGIHRLILRSMAACLDSTRP